MKVEVNRPPQTHEHQRKLPRVRGGWGRRIRVSVTWFILGLIALRVLYTVVILIPHPYAGYGLVLFLLLGAGAWFIVERRRRVVAIAGIGVLIAAAVVVLHVRATQVLTIRNQSGRPVSILHVSLMNGSRGAFFSLQNVPPGYEGTVRFLFPGYDGRNATAEGQFADGGQIESLSILAIFERSNFNYRRKMMLVLRNDGSVEWQYP